MFLLRIEPLHSDFQQCVMCDQQGLRPACVYAQSYQSICLSLEYSMNIKLLTVGHHFEFLTLKGGCRDSSESTLVQNDTLLEITCPGSNKKVSFELRTLIWTHDLIEFSLVVLQLEGPDAYSRDEPL